ncbi:MAG: alpha/beta hydrolase [Oligoflexus sp.]
MELKTLSNLWIPASVTSRKLILVLHGRGDSYAGFQGLPEALALSDVNYLLVNAPDPYFGGYSWYDLPPDQLPGIVRSRQLLDRMFAELIQSGFQAEDVVLFGFSQGCLMALEWGGRTSLSLAGYVGISGYSYDEVQLAQELTPRAKEAKWLITHGTKDEILPYERTAQQVEYLQSKGLPLEFHAFQKSHTIDDLEELPLLRQWLKTVF